MEKSLENITERGIAEIIPNKTELYKVLKSGKKIKIYFGIDPSTDLLHLGHGVILNKLKTFQELGHKVIILIGDFTATIGDPSGKLSARPKLSKEQVWRNARNYKNQLSRILKFEGENPAEIKFNSQWLGHLKPDEIIEILSNFTVQQLIERDMFQTRLKNGKPIFLHEFLYPVLQGYDSVALDIDAEIGGTDQTFNMLVGRQMMKHFKNKEKFVISVELLLGTDGEKMSKTANNYIALDSKPYDMFGKIMSINDALIRHYFTLATSIDINTISFSKPMEAKKRLAFEIVTQYYGKDQAEKALKEFENVIQKKQLPEDITEVLIPKSTTIDKILVNTGIAKSLSEAKRLIDQNAISIIREDKKAIKVNNAKLIPDFNFILKKGTREYRKIKIK